MTAARPLAAFAGFGIEIEYAIVNRETLDVMPVADWLLAQAAGMPANEFADGPIAWSNELSLHVIELKTNGPAATLTGLDALFAADLRRIEGLLAPRGARIMPGPMHPWMDPVREQRLWPHEQNEIYAAYDRIFGCRGHGWANLQSMHINLPFADEHEFVRLHGAIRTILPLLPALAAASPYVDGHASGWLDTRLEVYRRNQQRVPQITARVIPDAIASVDQYHARILEPMHAAIAPFDPEGVLRGEWLNSRGAIARFDRNAIEIRVLDAQESPRADLAVAKAVTAVVKDLYEERHSSAAQQAALATDLLADVFEQTLQHGERTPITAPSLLAALGLPGALEAGAAWQMMSARSAAESPDVQSLVACGPLARRLLAAGGAQPSRDTLGSLYRALCGALDRNAFFDPASQLLS